jgi:hypothetical protein
MPAFWDTSAIIHICVPGQSTRAAKRVLSQHAMIVWWTARTESLRESVCVQLERFHIRAADALHLAAALIWCHQRPHGRVFVCNDLHLGDAARQ